jgi:hypothetical protein
VLNISLPLSLSVSLLLDISLQTFFRGGGGGGGKEPPHGNVKYSEIIRYAGLYSSMLSRHENVGGFYSPGLSGD